MLTRILLFLPKNPADGIWTTMMKFIKGLLNCFVTSFTLYSHKSKMFTSSQPLSTAASKTLGFSHMVSEVHLLPLAVWPDVASTL